jgi:UDP-glucuronate 4-epimerase
MMPYMRRRMVCMQKPNRTTLLEHRTLNSLKYLVTGAAGFIGFHLSKRLLEDGHTVIGIDNLNNYYDPKLKKDRLALLKKYPNFTFHKINIANRKVMEGFFSSYNIEHRTSNTEQPGTFDYFIHLAAQAGVRYSLVNPYAYIDSNIVGFLNILEGCRRIKPKHLVFASSSSVYGANTKMPFSVHDNVDHPISLYAATKKANELMAHAYAHLYAIPCTGLRFFTVYGPWGRPDMALFLFTKSISEGKSIDIYNYGDMQRDFTYIDDIVEGVIRVIPNPPISNAPYSLYNIGNNNPIELMRLIEIIEECLGKKAIKNLLPMQLGDVKATYADIDDLARDVGFKPSTPIEEGVRRFVEWYKRYYRTQ